MIHHLDETDEETRMAYTSCFQLPDNGIRKLETTGNVDNVTCPHCIEAILAEWEANNEFGDSH
jgi:hypothetical protein